MKVDDRLRKMAQVTINWSRYIRESIVERIEREERKKAAQELLEDIRKRAANLNFPRRIPRIIGGSSRL